MSVFVDTSALLAILDADDSNHARAAAEWKRLLDADQPLWTTNYVLVETFALCQHRLGLAAVRTLQEDVVPVFRILWIDADHHGRAVASLLVAGRRRLSLVDCASFDAMRRHGIARAFAFDRDFARTGFEVVP